MLQQPTAGCIATFHKCCWDTKRGGIITNSTPRTHWGYITDASNTTKFGYMEHGLKYITFYVQKYITFLALCYNPPLVCDKPVGKPSSVKLIYWALRNKLGWTLNQIRFIQENAGRNLRLQNFRNFVQAWSHNMLTQWGPINWGIIISNDGMSPVRHQSISGTHYDDVIMGTIASQITSLTIVYSALYSGADQSKHQSSASLAFVWRIHRGPVNSPHKWPVTRKMSPFDDVIMNDRLLSIGP